MADGSEDEEGACSTFVSKEKLLVVNPSTSERKEFACVEYPGVVKNKDNALKTLGGIDNISKACVGKGYSRLELRFRPDDIYTKPTVARQSKPCCLAMKVKRRKVRKSPVKNGNQDECEYEYKAEMLGVVDKLFEFTGMADFQLLPPGLNDMHTHKQTPVDYELYQLKELYDESAVSKDHLEFVPPISVISKLDRPANFCYKPDAKHNVGAHTDRPIQQLPGRARLKRPNFTYGISFDHKGDVPCAPKPYTPNSNHPKSEMLKKLFDERPVWSRSALQAKLKISSVLCKQLLPLVAYNFTGGPWRTLWVRFGYDPRASPDGKKYQCLDFRVPRMLEPSVVAPSKNYQHRQIRPLGVGGEAVESRWKTGVTVEEKELQHSAQEDDPSAVAGEEEEGVIDVAYIFDPDHLPQQRQQFFQLCDLHDDSLQAIIHKNDGKESAKPNELMGWCEEDAYDKLRKQIIVLITAKAVKDGIILKGKQTLTEESEDKTSTTED